MKTIIVKVSHVKAENCSFIGINNVPSYLSKKLIVEILSRYTKYDVSTASELDVICGIHGNDVYYDTASCMEEAIDILKDIKLYTIKEKREWNVERNLVEVVQFRLSDIFDVNVSGKSVHCTFFKVNNVTEKKDVSFNDTTMKEDLHMKMAMSGYYYLNGDWEFHRINGKIVEAKRFEEKVVCTVVGKTRVEI